MILLPATLPEGRRGQSIAVAAPLCIILAVIIGILWPALRWYDGRQQRLAAGREQVAEILAEEKMLPELRQQAHAAALAAADAQVLLAGPSDAIAAANLELDLAGLAASSGASLTSTEVLPAQMAGALRQIGISVEVTADWLALTDLLVSIESARPRMIVDGLIIRSGAFGPPGTSLQASFSVLAFRNVATN
jgi:hypothetical protein